MVLQLQAAAWFGGRGGHGSKKYSVVTDPRCLTISSA